MIEPPPPPPSVTPAAAPPEGTAPWGGDEAMRAAPAFAAGQPAFAAAGTGGAVPMAAAPRRSFWHRLWRMAVALKDLLALAFLILFFLVLFALFSAGPGKAVTGKGALLLDLDGTISEQPAEVDPLSVLGQGDGVREYRAADVIQSLRAAATDDAVKAVVLDLDTFLGAGQVTLRDVGAAMDRVRKAGKPVLAYATAYGDDGYMLAAHASEVWMHPLGQTLVAGPGGSQLYLKGLIDRLGVTMNIYRVGTFKSAVEPLLRTDQSPEAEAAERAYATVLWDQWRAGVTGARPKAQIDAVANDPVGQLAQAGNDGARAALAAGLIDTIGDRDAFDRRVAKLVGASDAKRPADYDRIDWDDYVAANPVKSSGPAVAVVPIVGTIVDGEQPRGTAGGDTIAEHLADVAADSDIRAVVLRVDSPGGSVLASERIRSAALAVRRTGKPVVVSMANLAASGGYWVSMDADRIFAEPDTITGSIGVFGVIPSFEQSLAKVGVTTDGIQTTPLSGQPSLVSGTNDAFDALAQAGVEQIYDRFTTLVAKGRKLPVERVRTIAEGRVWAGGDARQLGLVDQFGGLDAAIADAAKRAKLDPDTVSVRWVEGDPDFWTRFISGFSADETPADTSRAGATGGGRGWVTLMDQRQKLSAARVVADWQRIAGGTGVQAACIECQAHAAPTRPAITLPGIAADAGGGWWRAAWRLVTGSGS